MKPLPSKKPSKEERENAALMGLISLYIETGRPIGSQTLKESGFDSLSPATLRNYFAKLEKEGLLKQHHSSGGRIPTPLGYKKYAEWIQKGSFEKPPFPKELEGILLEETKEVQSYLQKAAEAISHFTSGATFLSTPRFDQDFVGQIKLISIDSTRVLCVIITEFGLIRSEVLLLQEKLSVFSLKRIESFFTARLTGQTKPPLSLEEEKIANTLYNEAMFRHITSYASFSLSDILKTGFSKVLSYPEFGEASTLSGALALLENDQILRKVLSATENKQSIIVWIGEDLLELSPSSEGSSLITIPYYIQKNPVGAIGILCPNRAPYEKLFGILEGSAKAVSESLTRSLYKYKITYRQPKMAEIDLHTQTALLSQTEGAFLLEDKTGMKHK